MTQRNILDLKALVDETRSTLSNFVKSFKEYHADTMEEKSVRELVKSTSVTVAWIKSLTKKIRSCR